MSRFTAILPNKGHNPVKVSLGKTFQIVGHGIDIYNDEKGVLHFGINDEHVSKSKDRSMEDKINSIIDQVTNFNVSDPRVDVNKLAEQVMRCIKNDCFALNTLCSHLINDSEFLRLLAESHAEKHAQHHEEPSAKVVPALIASQLIPVMLPVLTDALIPILVDKLIPTLVDTLVPTLVDVVKPLVESQVTSMMGKQAEQKSYYSDSVGAKRLIGYGTFDLCEPVNLEGGQQTMIKVDVITDKNAIVKLSLGNDEVNNYCSAGDKRSLVLKTKVLNDVSLVPKITVEKMSSESVLIMTYIDDPVVTVVNEDHKQLAALRSSKSKSIAGSHNVEVDGEILRLISSNTLSWVELVGLKDIEIVEDTVILFKSLIDVANLSNGKLLAGFIDPETMSNDKPRGYYIIAQGLNQHAVYNYKTANGSEVYKESLMDPVTPIGGRVRVLPPATQGNLNEVLFSIMVMHQGSLLYKCGPNKAIVNLHKSESSLPAMIVLLGEDSSVVVRSWDIKCT